MLILTIQFGALILAVIVLSNFAGGGTSYSSTQSISRMYWGSPPPGTGISISGGTHTETMNASVVSVLYSLAQGTHLVSLAASRLCTNMNSTAAYAGDGVIYTNFTRLYDSSKKQDYFTFVPTGQPDGWSCIYSVTITDSLQQTTYLVTTIIVEPHASK